MSSFYGIYRATVLSNADPLNRRRLQVSIADVAGGAALWAEACIAPGSRARPREGQTVWVQFERGLATAPVWVGVMP